MISPGLTGLPGSSAGFPVIPARPETTKSPEHGPEDPYSGRPPHLSPYFSAELFHLSHFTLLFCLFIGSRQAPEYGSSGPCSRLFVVSGRAGMTGNPAEDPGSPVSPGEITNTDGHRSDLLSGTLFLSGSIRSYSTSTLNVMRFGENSFTCQCGKKREKRPWAKRLKGFRFRTFIGRF